MIQATILTFCSDLVKDHRFKQMPFCTACDRRFTEKEFAALPPAGYNIVWDIAYATCPDCNAEVQAWLCKVQGWRR